MLWGPIANPMSLHNIEVSMEGDETNVVEGKARVVDEAPQTASQGLPDYGECPMHPGQYFVTREAAWGGLQVSHRDQSEEGPDWCSLGNVLRPQFVNGWDKLGTADWERGRLGTETRTANEWLKGRYGKTWSKLSIEEMRDAIAAVQEVDTETGETPLDADVEEIDDGTDPDAMNGEELAYYKEQGMVG